MQRPVLFRKAVSGLLALLYAAAVADRAAPLLLQSVRREAPRLGGSFANWGLSFALFDCSLQYIRKKVGGRASGM